MYAIVWCMLQTFWGFFWTFDFWKVLLISFYCLKLIFIHKSDVTLLALAMAIMNITDEMVQERLLNCLLASSHTRSQNLKVVYLRTLWQSLLLMRKLVSEIEKRACWICGAVSENRKYKGLWVQCDICDACNIQSISVIHLEEKPVKSEKVLMNKDYKSLKEGKRQAVLLSERKNISARHVQSYYKLPTLPLLQVPLL